MFPMHCGQRSLRRSHLMTTMILISIDDYKMMISVLHTHHTIHVRDALRSCRVFAYCAYIIDEWLGVHVCAISGRINTHTHTHAFIQFDIKSPQRKLKKEKGDGGVGWGIMCVGFLCWRERRTTHIFVGVSARVVDLLVCVRIWQLATRVAKRSFFFARLLLWYIWLIFFFLQIITFYLQISYTLMWWLLICRHIFHNFVYDFVFVWRLFDCSCKIKDKHI